MRREEEKKDRGEKERERERECACWVVEGKEREEASDDGEGR